MPGGYGLAAVVCGDVKDDSGFPIEGANVIFEQTSSPYVTDDSCYTIYTGAFLTQLLAGNYNVTITHDDYEDLDGGSVTIQEAIINELGNFEMGVNMIEKSAFSVKPSSDQTNFAFNSWVTVAFGTEIYDVNGDFASNVFTAPETGLYDLKLNLRVLNLDISAAYYWAQIITSNRQYSNVITSNVFSNDVPNWTFIINQLADMAADDTAYVRIYQSGGTYQSDIYADSYFSGRFTGTTS